MMDGFSTWFASVRQANRRQLHHPPRIRRQRVLTLVCRHLRAKVTRRPIRSRPEDFRWPIAFNALGAEVCHRADADAADLTALCNLYDRNIGPDGEWLSPVSRVDFAMKGYSLLYVLQMTRNTRYRRAARALAKALLAHHPRTSDGCLPYDLGSRAILVDTLGMICPFLARFARLFDDQEPLSVSISQLQQFVANNVDADTCLPYHGYYADGPRRLGLHGWGRGTGWYMLGLVDTLLEIPLEHPAYAGLQLAFSAAAQTLRDLQREDGHWTWAVLHREPQVDSSTTAILGYGLLRAVQAGIVETSYGATAEHAIEALMNCTHADGFVHGALGECRGLGKYPQLYGPQPWAQGPTTALAALYASQSGARQ